MGPELKPRPSMLKTLFKNYLVVLPQWYIENHQWNVEIISAPECPKVETLRLVKTSPSNFELRNGFIYGHSFTKVLQFCPEHPGKKKLYEESHSKSRYCSWGSIFPDRRWPTADWFQWRPNGRFNIRNGAIWWFHYRRLCRFISKSYIKDIFWQGSIATFTHYHTGAVRWSLLLGINMFTSLVLKKSNGFYFKTTIL